MTRQIMIGPLLIRPAWTHGSPVRTGRMHGPDGETALQRCTTSFFRCPARASGWPVRTGRFTKNHAQAGRRAVHLGRAPG